jgi:hypothetical protein
MWRNVMLGAGLVVLATGCGAGGATVGGSDVAPVAEPQLYQVDATVLQRDGDVAQICFAVMESYPPQCGGVPIANWDWNAVSRKDSASGTTWGSYHLVGSYDGDTFTVTDVGPAEPAVPAVVDLTPACPKPAGGWAAPDPSRGTDEYVSAPDTYARQQPDYVASWVTYVEDTPGLVVFNAVFTGDAERHEAELLQVWSGPLCVVAQDVPTAAELEAIRQEAEARLAELGVELVSSTAERIVDLQVVLDEDGRAQAEFDEEYGPGVVRVTSLLRPAKQ